jgi:NTP pyrophosphatase (non-canonical NTP hydrolase)
MSYGNKSFTDMQDEIREVNQANGWYEASRPFEADVSLLHSEVSEMFEAFRQWGLDDATHQFAIRDGESIPKPEGVGSEAADVLIRLLDTCDRYGIDLRQEYNRKLAHNRTRGHRHGGKRV